MPNPPKFTYFFILTFKAALLREFCDFLFAQDKDFLKPLLHKMHVNPPAEVSTSMKVFFSKNMHVFFYFLQSANVIFRIHYKTNSVAIMECVMCHSGVPRAHAGEDIPGRRLLLGNHSYFRRLCTL